MTNAAFITRLPPSAKRLSPPNYTAIAKSLPSPKKGNSPSTDLTHPPMLSDQPQQKYRVCYAKLLRLYPKAYRDRFAPEMDQTFSDLCRERLKSGEGLFVLAL